jgi:hypothetical protein
VDNFFYSQGFPQAFLDWKNGLVLRVRHRLFVGLKIVIYRPTHIVSH